VHTLPFLAICGVLLCAYRYRGALIPRRGTTEWIDFMVKRPKLRFEFKLHPLVKRDIIPVAVLTAVFAFTGFLRLGDVKAPTSYHTFSGEGDSIVVRLPEDTAVAQLMYFTGLNFGHNDSHYTLEYLSGNSWIEIPSAKPVTDEHKSGEHPTAMPQFGSDLFKWMYADNASCMTSALRITASRKSELCEIAVYDFSGRPVALYDGGELTDEQQLVPDKPEYMNSMYFDEIYHGRAALETIRNLDIYETVHPPLGKTLISVGVQIFGMTPFGWRVMGVLFGILMIPAMYVLLKNMFGKIPVAVCGTLLLGFDFMHYTQTRIATVDTYPVLFIILSFLFMYRFIATEHDAPLRRHVWNLFLSGLAFGIGAATKWIVLYAGAGLAALFFMRIIFDYFYYYLDNGTPGVFLARTVKILACAFAFFVAIPAVIYIVSYIPYGHELTDPKTGRMMTVGSGMLWSKAYYKHVWAINKSMYTYHATLKATHSYQSSWYQWIIDARPILYFWKRAEPYVGSATQVSVITAFTNPVTTWAGLLATGSLFERVFRRRDAVALVILIGFFAQLLPWILISRCVFAYHFFPSMIFYIIAIAYAFNNFFERGGRNAKRYIYGFTAAAGVAFLLFFPAISGFSASEWYHNNVLSWFGSWLV
jgi:hypothetical protein